jgi:sterol desaturase/sphingolipid hydroxylase (fatty acid hydroxylase superfamily)
VFENPVLERFTHVHPIIPLVMWTPVILFFIVRSFVVLGLGVGQMFVTAVAALMFWTIMEYVLHRYVFHFNAVSPFGKRIQFLIHGLHHDDPNDPTRLVMPPIGSLILGVIFWFSFRAVLGPVWVQPFYAFFAIGYLAYDYTHYAVHHFNPRTEFGKRVKKHHMRHHFVNPEAGFGVSSPLWDLILGTEDSPSSKKTASAER